MAEAKLKPTQKSVERLIREAPDDSVRGDCDELVRIMKIAKSVSYLRKRYPS